MYAYFDRALRRVSGSLIARFVALISSAFCLTGCVGFFDAELNNRGGYLDKKLDNYWMIADTKQMRVLRAYVLIGSVLRLARTTYPSEREILVQHVNSAIAVAGDAYYCAYAPPGQCVYFDERMVELETAVLRILIAVLSKKEDEDLAEGVSKLVGETIPLFKNIGSLTQLLDALTSTGQIAVNAGKIVSSIIQIGQIGYTYGRRLGAVYRDSVELELITVLSSLDVQCRLQTGQGKLQYVRANGHYKEVDLSRAEQWTTDHFYGDVHLQKNACGVFRNGHDLWRQGSGNFDKWVTFLNTDAVAFRQSIVPNESAFIQASDLIWRSCEQLTDKADLISKCIGRRTIEGQQPLPCAETSDSFVQESEKEKPAPDATTIPDKTDKATRSEKPSVRLALAQQCRLILYNKTRVARQNRLSEADTRLYWLSTLTPSIGHPPSARDRN